MLINNTTVTAKNNFSSIKETVYKNSIGIMSDEELRVFNQYLDDKLSDFSPSMMVYGTYNAGKSSLLNALFGQVEKAKTGDSPETAKVYSHQYNGYTIYDTPGINAPIEHEEVTNDHLKKTEIILFVISNDGSLEEEYVYQKISEIVKSNKPLIIVLNNKRGIDIYSKEALAEVDKVNLNLSKIGDRNGIDHIEQKVSFCMVNAQTALKGKLEDKNLILNKSNILKLELLIDKKFSMSGSKEVINALNAYIQNFIDVVVLSIDARVENVQAKKTEELITYLEKFKASSGVRLTNVVDKQMLRLSGELESILSRGGDIQNEILSSIDNNVKKIEQLVTMEFNKIESELKIKIEGFSVELKEISTGYSEGLPENREEFPDSTSSFPPVFEGKAKELLSNPKTMGTCVKQTLTLAKKYLPKKVMLGKGPVWIDKISAKAGPAITVVVALYEVYSSFKEQNEMIEQERIKVMNTRNQANDISDEIKLELYSSIHNELLLVFGDLISQLRKESNELSGNNKILIEKKCELKRAQSLLSSM